MRVAIFVFGRKRPGFDPEWGRQIEQAAHGAVDSWLFSCFWPPTRVVDDTTLRQAVHQAREAGCEVAVVLQPTMGDGRLAPMLGQLWDDPIVFWATPERPDSPKVSSCSLVGTHVFASMFRQLGRPFEVVYGDPAAKDTLRQLAVAVRLAALGAQLRRSKIGLVGSHVPGFVNMHVEPAQLSRGLGVQLHDFGLQEFFALIEGQEAQAVAADVEIAMAMQIPFAEDVGRDDLPINSRYYLAMKGLLDEENLDALAVRCWPELPARFGGWPYLAMARLAEEGRVVALEGDVDGALSCLVGQQLGLGPGYISDWLAHDDHTLTLWHPGHAALGMCQPGSPRLGRHFNNELPLVIDAELAADQPVTLFRLWHCDGTAHLMAQHARTAVPRRKLKGAHGLLVIDDRYVPDWFDQLCHAGMPHHVSLVPGHHAHLLWRAARQLGIAWFGHAPVSSSAQQ
jgi:L-fucose isomerase-like protein